MSVFGLHFRKSQLRTIIAIGAAAAALVFQDTILTSAYQHTRASLGIAAPPPNMLVCSAYTLLMIFRLAWWLAVAALIALINPPSIASVLRSDRRQAMYFLKGLAIGFGVMAATVLMIVAVGDGQIRTSPGTAAVHTAYGIAWFLAEILGAAGEEILYRGLLLILVTRLFGMRTAMVISALAFMAGHGANPGASTVWMVRLALAGLLLAYSVFRSGTIWWAIGYHAGWNFASAPLFGAAGSGFRDQGSSFTFLPSGNALITGGPVGPEGSAFAFLAVVIGIGFLVLTIPP